MRGYDLKFKVLSCKYSQLTNAVLPVISIFIHLYSHEKSLVSIFLRLKQEHSWEFFILPIPFHHL